MPDRRSDPWRDDVSSSVDVLQGGIEPPHWRRRWAAVPPRARRVGAGLLVLLVLAAAVVWFRDRAAERDRAQRVELAASLAVTSSSTSPLGGQVSFFVLVRNGGERPLSITSVDGTGDGLLLRMRDDGERAVGTGAEVAIPLSVRLTCAAGGDGGLTAEIGVRRQDGGSTTRQVVLEPAFLVLDVAATLCAVRPDLRDHELSGPVLRGGAAKGGEGR